MMLRLCWRSGKETGLKALFLRLLAAEAIVGGVALLIVELFPMRLIGVNADLKL